MKQYQKALSLMIVFTVIIGAVCFPAWATEATEVNTASMQENCTEPTEETSTPTENMTEPPEAPPLQTEPSETQSKEEIEATIPSEPTHKVVDIDLGEYEKEMIVGDTQLLSPTAIFDRPNLDNLPEFYYSSSNTEVATVNALGRITAVTSGNAVIYVTCAEITKTVDIVVKIIAVQDLDIEEHEDTLEVGKSLNLSVSVIPSDATDSSIIFESSDPKIATVNANGKITGIAPGEVKIIIRSGDVIKSVPLVVKIKTESITIEEPYVVLKPEETHLISATVTPTTAPQLLSFTSLDEDVAVVNDNGVIHAVAPGSTSIIISNGDQKAVVTVIVNKSTKETEVETEEGNHEVSRPDGALEQMAQKIASSKDGEVFRVNGRDIDTIPSEVLSVLYGSQKVLIIDCDNYSISVRGSKVKNTQNHIVTSIMFNKTELGLEFALNNNDNLPGEISINLGAPYLKYKFLYLYNESLQKWQLLNSYENGVITVDCAGVYLLTTEKISIERINWLAASCGISGIIVAMFFYVLTKKKYWFW